MVKVVPAILTEDTEALEKMVRQAESFTNYVQIDIMDGKFVPSKSITSAHLATIPIKLNWEVHLMVEHPEQYLEAFQKTGAQKVVFHYEATNTPLEVISIAKTIKLKVGLAVNPETPITEILPLVSEVDSILFLTVHPGFYGSSFVPEVLDKVMEFYSIQPRVEIGVDGGIKEHNIAQVAQAGANVIYVGSAVFLQPDPGQSFRRLKAIVEQSQ